MKTTKYGAATLALTTGFLIGAVANAATAQTQSVTTLPDARQKLKSAVVEDADGHTIGRVEDVRPTSGVPLNVQVALKTASGTSKIVTIAAADLRYDASKSAVVTDLPRTDLDAMRNAPIR